MNNETIFCPGGAASQTGVAAAERYPGIVISTCGETIGNVPSQLDTCSGPFAIPIWNSHQGEVKAAEFVWDHIETAKIRISDVWAKRIEFWFVRKIGVTTSHGKIGSVVVAETQCSGFLQSRGAALEKYPLTTVAFSEYRRGAALDGVLVAPGQGESGEEFEIVSRETANPNNFTSFVRFVPTRAYKEQQFPVSWLTGVTMRPFDVSLSDAEQSFFEQMLENVTDLRDIPKLIFVLKRTAKVGLLFEGTRLYVGDLLDAEELESGEISVFENAGATVKMYTEELRNLFLNDFPALHRHDFILHRGVNTVLFACPPLCLYTHGYQEETVEPVFRFYISKLFERWDSDAKCTAEQAEFFERHKSSWQKKGSEFIKFTIVGAT